MDFCMRHRPVACDGCQAKMVRVVEYLIITVSSQERLSPPTADVCVLVNVYPVTVCAISNLNIHTRDVVCPCHLSMMCFNV